MTSAISILLLAYFSFEEANIAVGNIKNVMNSHNDDLVSQCRNMATSPNTITIKISNYCSRVHSMIHFIPSRIPSSNMANKFQSKVPKAEQESHISDTQAVAPDMKDPLQPGSSDMDERMSMQLFPFSVLDDILFR